MFTHLHVHSNYSFCRGADRLETLVVAARRRGYESLALTDTNGLYGLVWFLTAAREAGIRPIIGAEAVYGRERAVVLVKNREAYAGLCRLLTRIHQALGTPVRMAPDASWKPDGPCDPVHDPDDGRGPVRITARPIRHAPDPRFSLAAAMAELPSGAVILSPCPDLLDVLARARGTADLYVELRPGVPTRLRAFARASGLPPVATGGVHFVDPEGRRRHHLLRAIALNTSLDRVPAEELATPDAFLATPAEMARRFPDLPGALETAGRIAEECTFTPEMGRPIFPVYQTLDGVRLEGDAVTDHLEQDCREGIRRRYGRITPEAERRLGRELGIIRDKGFAPYFLVVRDIVRQAPRTCGRGSAAASLVSYALAITHVDPIRYDLFFDRFLNPGRVDPPDIDVDFPWDERDKLLEWVFARFGRRRAAMIANQNSFQARGAVREIAKVWGLPDAEIGRISKRIPWYSTHEDPEELVRTHPLFKDVDLSEPWPSILRAARDLDGFPRHLSVHCGGVVIVPDAVDRYVPVQPAAKGVDVVQWEKDQSEEFGLVKIDLLGNRSLAVIRDACASIRTQGGPDIVFERFQPLDDPRTQDLLARGETLGVFYVESPAMRQLQTKCGTGNFERLVVHSSIIRPATNDYIREYIRRLKGGAYEPLHPILDDIMKESFGIMVYQEDVAKTVIAMAGFDAASADDLRKVLSRKHKEKKLADYKDRFYRGATERGFSTEVMDRIWNMILSFAGYSFCKPHSASYALVSFKSAWLRAHYPAEFIAGVISNGGGYYSTFAYISEARRMKLRVLLPDVNLSEKAYTGRTWGTDPHAGEAFTEAGAHEMFGVIKTSGASHCGEQTHRATRNPQRGRPGPPASLVSDDPPSAVTGELRGEVRVGFQQLKGFPEAAILACLQERERGGPFRSLEDFLARAGERLGPAAVKILVRAGAFDDLEGGLAARPGAMWKILAWQRALERRCARGRPLWDLEDTAASPPALEPYADGRVLEQEVEALGFLISRHPLTLFEDAVARLRLRPGPPVIEGHDLPRHVGHLVRLVGWFVTAKTVHTKKGEPMEFLSFEDTTALYETTFFPKTYARFCHMMNHDRPYVIAGRVEEDFGAVAVTVSDVAYLASDAERSGGGVSLAPPLPPHHGGMGPDWVGLQ